MGWTAAHRYAHAPRRCGPSFWKPYKSFKKFSKLYDLLQDASSCIQGIIVIWRRNRTSAWGSVLVSHVDDHQPMGIASVSRARKGMQVTHKSRGTGSIRCNVSMVAQSYSAKSRAQAWF